MTGMLKRMSFGLVKKDWSPCKWSIYDVGAVLVIIICAEIAGYKLRDLTKENKVLCDLAEAGMTMIGGTVTIAWLWLFRKVTPRDLDFRRGRWRIGKSMGIAVGIGLACGIMMLALEGKVVHLLVMIVVIFGIIIHTPLSPTLLGLWILTPVSEEVLFRGFLYAYLRPRIGVLSSLLLQAAICAALHLYRLDQLGRLDQFGVIVVMAVVFGLLYEFSGSLYPSIICHSIYNMTVVAIMTAVKLGL